MSSLLYSEKATNNPAMIYPAEYPVFAVNPQAVEDARLDLYADGKMRMIILYIGGRNICSMTPAAKKTANFFITVKHCK